MKTAKSMRNKIILNIAILALFSKSIACEDMNIDHRITSDQEGIFDKMRLKMTQKENELLQTQQPAQIKKPQIQAIAIHHEVPQIQKKQIPKQIKQNVKDTKILPINSKNNVQLKDDEEDERDDFEGFGSITELVKNKDKLVQKTLQDPAFKQELAQKQKEEKEAKEREQREKEAKEEEEKQRKIQETKKKLQGARAKIEEALNKAAKKQAIVAKVQQKKVEPVVVQTQALSQQKTQEHVENSGQMTAYQKAISSVLGKVNHVQQPVQTVSSSSQAVSQTSDEPIGFIGKYSQKISQQQQAKKNENEIELDQSLPKVQIPFSKQAPKHKGMMARAMEKEIKEQFAKEQKEKNELMKEALNDPLFQLQMHGLN